MDPAAYLSVPAAIDFQREYDWPQVRATCHALAVAARAHIAELTGLPPISPDDWLGQMSAAALPAGSIDRLGQRLWDEFGIEVPLVRWQDREFVRVSIQAYNSPDDVERLLAALRRLLF